ncbi:hypothetical protein ACOB9N_10635 [Pasteurella multocida]|uniref:hypothetical protein n=1 Tax=Pasteurella multocida TaxID=747 RepID=UPI003BA396B2
MKRTAIKLEKLRYARWSGRRNSYTASLKGESYVVNVGDGYMLCLSSECYPKLNRTIKNDVYFWGFKNLGKFIDKQSWRQVYQSLRRELKRINQQKMQGGAK